MNNSPDFLIIGAMKSASTTLHTQLALQPGIFMSEVKEPCFFSHDDNYAKGMESYLSLFKEASSDELCGESSTDYTKLPTYPHTIDRISKHLPDVKLIYLMRHPIDRLLSHYAHEWTLGRMSININQAIAKHPELIDYSRYSMQLAPYFETFGRERVLPVFFERLVKQQQAEIERICDFIGYKGKPTWRTDFDLQNVSSVRMRKNKLRDFFLELPVLKEIRQQFIPKSWRKLVRENIWMMTKKPEINSKNLEYIRSVFDEDLAVLSSWLGIELCCDNFKTAVVSYDKSW